MKVYNFIVICCLGLILVACQRTSKTGGSGNSTSANAVATDSWVYFNSVEAGFAVKMPLEPEKTSEIVTTSAGEINTYLFTAESNGTSYLVAYSDYPDEVIKKTTADKLLASARDGAVAKIQGTLFDQQNIPFAGFPGIEIKAATQDGKTILRARFYLVNNRLYQVMTMSPGDKASPADIDKFFNSFVLTNF